MHTLDTPALVKKFDPQNALGSVDLLGAQIEQAWREMKGVSIPASYRSIDTVVVNGMGGSALAAHMIQSIFYEELKKPLVIINDYRVPGIVNRNTLYVISSYSGSTEETVSTFTAAQKRGAKLFGISSGADVGKLVHSGKMPGYIFNPTANPSQSPRIGLGYSLAAHLALLKRLGILTLSDSDVRLVYQHLVLFRKKFGFDTPFQKNSAKQLAQQLHGKAVAVVASQHLVGNAHVFANQLNETSKTFAVHHPIPELNHHLLEGLRLPVENRIALGFIFLESRLYHPKNQQRYAITQKIVTNNKVAWERYRLTAPDKLTQALEALALSSYVTFYLALLNKLNPNLIPYVDFLKAQLKKTRSV